MSRRTKRWLWATIPVLLMVALFVALFVLLPVTFSLPAALGLVIGTVWAVWLVNRRLKRYEKKP
jgi:hypothetical protein